MRPDTAGQRYEEINVHDIHLSGTDDIVGWELTHGTAISGTPPPPSSATSRWRTSRAPPLRSECGLPATLVHSDNHPGNARGSSEGVSLLDWGEAFVGSPVTDLLSLVGGLSPAEAAPLVAHWCASWKHLAPRSKPERALELAPFIATLHGAATYAQTVAEPVRAQMPA